MFLLLLVGMPVILGNLLLQSAISYWSLRFFSGGLIG